MMAGVHVYLEAVFVLRWQDVALALLYLVTAAVGFLGASSIWWFGLYVLGHPKKGIRRSDPAALRRVNRVFDATLLGGALLGLVMAFTDWIPSRVSYLVGGLALGFFLHQYVPDKARYRVESVTGRVFVPLLKARAGRRRA